VGGISLFPALLQMKPSIFTSNKVKSWAHQASAGAYKKKVLGARNHGFLKSIAFI
jgi:hypothetical protein